MNLKKICIIPILIIHIDIFIRIIKNTSHYFLNNKQKPINGEKQNNPPKNHFHCLHKIPLTPRYRKNQNNGIYKEQEKRKPKSKSFECIQSFYTKIFSCHDNILCQLRLLYTSFLKKSRVLKYFVQTLLSKPYILINHFYQSSYINKRTIQ